MSISGRVEINLKIGLDFHFIFLRSFFSKLLYESVIRKNEREANCCWSDICQPESRGLHLYQGKQYWDLAHNQHRVLLRIFTYTALQVVYFDTTFSEDYWIS